MSNNKEAQEDELLALTSIYDEEEFHRAESAQGGEIQLCLELPADFKIVVKGRPAGMVAAYLSAHLIQKQMSTSRCCRAHTDGIYCLLLASTGAQL